MIERFRQKFNVAKERAGAFERNPPVWAIVVAGLAIWITMQALKALL